MGVKGGWLAVTWRAEEVCNRGRLLNWTGVQTGCGLDDGWQSNEAEHQVAILAET